MKKPVIYTVGHSTHPIEEFLELLGVHGVEQVVDVRTIPKSRHNPQFNADALEKSLRKAHLGYRHMKELGGLRHAKKDSLNVGWRNASFRGYADYMSTPEFEEALASLMEIASERVTAIMCAEVLPWRCHRSLIGDALTKKVWLVRDIMSRTSATPHRLTPFLKVRRGKLVYPAPKE